VSLVDGKVVYVQMPAEELRRRNLELALADLNEVIRLRPRDSHYYYVRGRLYEELGEPEKAAADFERSGVRRAR
jgi:Tfp pilus assembly protein PilF